MPDTVEAIVATSKILVAALRTTEAMGMWPLLKNQSPREGIPQTIGELNQQVSHAYDLSLSAAIQLSIPVAGSVSGGFNRRVIVLERKAYKEIKEDEITYQYGYAIRMAITVNKLDGSMELSLPFLAASAEVGHIEGRWTLHIAGLSGPKIDAAILPPRELSVETFVLAQQSIANAIEAINDPTTVFSAVQLLAKNPNATLESTYKTHAAAAYALGAIERNKSLKQALEDLDGENNLTVDTISDVYKNFADIQELTTKPSPTVRSEAKRILGDISVKTRGW